MVRRRPRGKSRQVCPQCGSDRLIFNSGMITGQVYHCLKCDYLGSLVFETDLPVAGAKSEPLPREDE
jgi:hypothetical protein